MKNYFKRNIILLGVLLVLTFSMIIIRVIFPRNIVSHDNFDHGSSGNW